MQNQKHLDVQRRGFSLVEIALALGVIAFALLSVVALLSTGVKSNEISVEETRATAILTLLEADLRNTSPAYNSTSAIYHLPLPYAANPTTSASIFNPALQVNTPLHRRAERGGATAGFFHQSPGRAFSAP